MPLTRLPGNTNQEQQQTTTSDAASKKSQGAFSSFNRQAQLEANDGNQGQGQQGQQSNPGQGEEHRQEGKAKGKNKHNVEEDFVPIATSGNKVYVSWWERNQTSNEPVLRVSNDNGKTFGEKIMLSMK